MTEEQNQVPEKTFEELHPAPCVIHNLPYPQYHDMLGLRSGVLSKFAESDLAALYQIGELYRDTDALIVGRAFHTLLLEPELFERDVTILPMGFNLSRKADKATYAGLISDNPDGTIIRHHAGEQIKKMAESCKMHPLYDEIMRPGSREITIRYFQPTSAGDVLCKARIDWLINDGGAAHTIIDVKTTKDTPSDSNMSKTIFNYGYHRQAAMQLRAIGLGPHQSKLDRYIWLFQQNVPPYDTAFKLMSDDMRHDAMSDVDAYTLRYKIASDSGRWPGVSSELEEIDLPSWASDDTIIRDPRGGPVDLTEEDIDDAQASL